MAQKIPTMTLIQWLIHLIDTPKWRCGSVTGSKHPDITQKEINQIGKQRLLKEAEELECKGLIQVEWAEFHTDIKKIHFSVDIMEELCRTEGLTNPKERLERMRNAVLYWLEKTANTWIQPYYEKLLDKINRGEYAAETEEPEFLKCVYLVSKEKEVVWKRIFSAAALNRSKDFENKYEKRIITILRKYSPKLHEGMSGEEVLAEQGILSYSQKLEIKGALKYMIEDKHLMDTAEQIYGTILNAQTLAAGKLTDIRGIKRIITIENKANYENMKFDKEILYIFCHGFFSLKERKFLDQLVLLAKPGVAYLHWGDMDYGGIQIYNFIKNRLFLELQPLYMNRKTYEDALKCRAGYPISAEKYKKLQNMDAGDLIELKECILEYKMEVEQEMVLAKELNYNLKRIF